MNLLQCAKKLSTLEEFSQVEIAVSQPFALLLANFIQYLIVFSKYRIKLASAMRPFETFFSLHPVFTFEEARSYLSKQGFPPAFIHQFFHYHLKRGRILRVRREVYYVVPSGTQAATCPVDPYLVSSKLAPDAVLGYHTALDLHGYAHSMWSHFHYFTQIQAKKPFIFRGSTYQAVSLPAALVKAKKTDFGVMRVERMGAIIRVTTLERTLVDALDRPTLTGSWEEIWKSFEGIEFLDTKKILEYTFLLSNQLIAAKVGYFLDMHREQFKVHKTDLAKLRRHIPTEPRYLERPKRGPQVLIKAWNLIIPEFLHQRKWEEPHGDF